MPTWLAALLAVIAYSLVVTIIVAVFDPFTPCEPHGDLFLDIIVGPVGWILLLLCLPANLYTNNGFFETVIYEPVTDGPGYREKKLETWVVHGGPKTHDFLKARTEAFGPKVEARTRMISCSEYLKRRKDNPRMK